MQNIEVLYIPVSLDIVRIFVDYHPNTTVNEVLLAAKIYELYPETQDLPVGIYGKLVSKNTVVSMGDRIELYRALKLDPKEKRRLKAHNSNLRLRPK